MFQQLATIRTKTTPVARVAVGGTVVVTIMGTTAMAATITQNGPLCGVERN